MAKKVTIEDLAISANRHHAEVEKHLRYALREAKLAGDDLNKIKKMLGHGEWIPWVNEHFEAQLWTANVYRRISSSWPELESRYGKDLEEMSLREALAILTHRKEEEVDDEEERKWNERVKRARSRFVDTLNQMLDLWQEDRKSEQFIVFTAEHFIPDADDDDDFRYEASLLEVWLEKLKKEVQPFADALPPTPDGCFDYSNLSKLGQQKNQSEYQQTLITNLVESHVHEEAELFY